MSPGATAASSRKRKTRLVAGVPGSCGTVYHASAYASVPCGFGNFAGTGVLAASRSDVIGVTVAAVAGGVGGVGWVPV